jgi:hypothetical protein
MTRYTAITSGLKQLDDLEWLIYAGDDGSVLVYRPKPIKWKQHHWLQLLQTKTISHGYWSVSISGKSNGFRKLYVQEVILTAFDRPRPNANYVAMHKDGDPNNNRFDNLEWGDQVTNQKARVYHRVMRQKVHDMLEGGTVTMKCYAKNWVGKFEHPNAPWSSASGWSTNPADATRMAISKFLGSNLTWEKQRIGFGGASEAVRIPLGFEVIDTSRIATWKEQSIYKELRLSRTTSGDVLSS